MHIYHLLNPDQEQVKVTEFLFIFFYFLRELLV